MVCGHYFSNLLYDTLFGTFKKWTANGIQCGLNSCLLSMINYPSVKIDTMKKITETLLLVCNGVVLEVKVEKTEFMSLHQDFGPHYNTEIANTSHTNVARSKFLETIGTIKTVLLNELSQDDVLRMLTIPQCRTCSLFICYQNIGSMKQQFVVTHSTQFYMRRKKLGQPSMDKYYSMLYCHENIQTSDFFLDTTF